MKAMVIIESWFGNTKAIADEIARVLNARGMQPQVIDIQDAPSAVPTDVGLLVIGAPTHNRSLSTAATREKAAAGKASGTSSAEEDRAGKVRRGVREWLGDTAISDGLRIAVFDTVTGKNWLSGSAAKAAAKMLRSRFPEAAVDVRSFVVRATAGPLADGEIEAAHQWGEELAR
ncbi:flavodoxin [Actinomycetaceae bacterium L2_0104]